MISNWQKNILKNIFTSKFKDRSVYTIYVRVCLCKYVCEEPVNQPIRQKAYFTRITVLKKCKKQQIKSLEQRIKKTDHYLIFIKMNPFSNHAVIINNDDYVKFKYFHICIFYVNLSSLAEN